MSKEALAKAMAELEEERVIALVKELLGSGTAPLDIVKSLQEGMTEVGKRFERGDYFLSELVMAGEVMKGAMDILEPHLSGESAENKGTVVIGTVKGDIHDLGKNIVIMLLKGAGYNVVDLGVDVPKEKFVAAVKETGAPLVGMSVLLTSCQGALKETIDALRAEGLTPKVVIGGNYVDETVRKHVGADYFAATAGDGLKVASEVFGG
ncbi:MAG: cobalamin B12-binding domain-containing protein [Thermoanaerobacteraceae bacterium]|uniref:cobalamin B12-binding domain-containing protein n=1 Tax=Thermanaeromonas sp. C210 TaxID=2731925 RepID=UPI00155C33AC|nr:cobalamin-dependent protein [Thermanaeromonas sp. C210]MBE3581664.1 cobalamin B12-binding domain-containing protein [Thermoanaerobacteraceae bacterium]GFN22374.1 5-methyltetrahydrofolate--homocysteine methyltransferase [Thermanaeromonas sp. C210]